jgi:hypothetical protein
MSNNVVRWVIVVVVVVAVVAMLAWRRNEPGVGGRIPDPEDATAVIFSAPPPGGVPDPVPVSTT